MPSPTLSGAQGIAEWAPFAARLAIRLAGMAQAGQVRAGTPFWETAVDQLLLHAIDTDVKARACHRGTPHRKPAAVCKLVSFHMLGRRSCVCICVHAMNAPGVVTPPWLLLAVALSYFDTLPTNCKDVL